MSIVYCPSCEQELELDDAYRDWTVRCPHCEREFVPNGRNRRRPPRDEQDGDDEYVYGYEGAQREEALAQVKGPGLAMEICGWGGLVLIGLACLLLVAASFAEQGNNAQEMLALSCCAGVFLLPYSLVMAMGGRGMRKLSSRGWALTAAILGVVSLVFLFAGFCLGVVYGPIGIWALVVLERPAVRRAFAAPGRDRRNWD